MICCLSFLIKMFYSIISICRTAYDEIYIFRGKENLCDILHRIADELPVAGW